MSPSAVNLHQTRALNLRQDLETLIQTRIGEIRIPRVMLHATTVDTKDIMRQSADSRKWSAMDVDSQGTWSQIAQINKHLIHHQRETTDQETER